jgi:hypothetical protein
MEPLVAMETATLTEFIPRVTGFGVNVHVEFAGSPEQVSAMGLLNEPPTGIRSIEYFAVPPGGTD